MDLISREAAIEAIKDPVVKGFAMYALKSVPAVPAVPLDKLCELLSSMYRCPSSGFPSSGRVCSPYCSDKLMNKLCGSDCEKFTDAERWKMFLTEWMEEQDAKEET